MVAEREHPHRRVLFRCEVCEREFEVIDPSAEERRCMSQIVPGVQCLGVMRMKAVEEFYNGD